MDEVERTVKALADPHRRVLLDALRERDGRSVSELEAVLPELGRHAVLKHLGVLETAGLVTTSKTGRVRTVHLNPVPIVALAQRWLDDYSAFAGLALLNLRNHLRPKDTAMPTTTRSVVASIVIEATPDRVWEALTDPDQTSQWFFGGHITSDWQVGSPLVYLDADGAPLISGEITAIEPGVRLAHTWSATWSPETAADPVSSFEWLLEQQGPLTRVTIRHTDIPDGSATAQQVEGGNVTVLSSLKTFVETGRGLTGMAG